MKSIQTTLFLGIFFFGTSLSFAQNPYKSLGIEIEPLTLSKGKFVEFFPNDSLVQIGSVILDTRNNSIVSFVVVDTAYSEATLEPEIIVRFLQPDPLAADYPNLSPYSYVANNPLIFTDPTGAYIVDSNGNRVDVTTTQDEDGNYVNSYAFADGTEQSVIDDFHANGGTILNAMTLTEEGRTQLGNINTADYGIGFTLSDEAPPTSLTQGETAVSYDKNNDGSFTPTGAHITVYTKGIENAQNTSFNDTRGFYNAMGTTAMIGATGAHEGVHATDPKSFTDRRDPNYNYEKAPMESTMRYTYQFLMNRMYLPKKQ